MSTSWSRMVSGLGFLTGLMARKQPPVVVETPRVAPTRPEIRRPPSMLLAALLSLACLGIPDAGAHVGVTFCATASLDGGAHSAPAC